MAFKYISNVIGKKADCQLLQAMWPMLLPTASVSNVSASIVLLLFLTWKQNFFFSACFTTGGSCKKSPDKIN